MLTIKLIFPPAHTKCSTLRACIATTSPLCTTVSYIYISWLIQWGLLGCQMSVGDQITFINTSTICWWCAAVLRVPVTWTAVQVDVTAPLPGPTRHLDWGCLLASAGVGNLLFSSTSTASHYGNRWSSARRCRTVCHADGETCLDNGVNLLTFWHPVPTSHGLP